jgi:oxygen-dependent protoporphyrinogen oxidase
MKRIIIIGGGITGLAAAHRLIELRTQSDEPLSLTILEAGQRLGGIIHTEERDGFLIERGPDSFISEKPEALELANRADLASNLIETNEKHRRSFIVRKGKLRPVPEGFHLLAPSRLWPFFTSDILSFKGKVRLAGEVFVPRAAEGNGVGDESLASFVRRRLGHEALERVAQPMVGGIYTADPEKLSLRATMPRFLEMERKHGSLFRAMASARQASAAGENAGTSGARYSLFLSFDHGMQLLVDHLGRRIADCGMQAADLPKRVDVAIRLNSTVKSVEMDHAPATPNWHVRTENGEMLLADAVCLALPAYTCARLLRNVDSELATKLEAISYASTATINLAYKRADIPHPLHGFGFVVPFIEKRTLLACTFSSVKFAGRAPQDHVLLRAFVGGALQPEIFALDDGEMVRRVGDDLRALLGIAKPPLFAEVARWPNSMPQYHVGHLDLVASIQARAARLSGLQLAGNSYTGTGIPDCVRSGEEAANSLVTQLLVLQSD